MHAWLSTSATTALRNPTSSGAAAQPRIVNPAFQQSTPCGYTTMNPLWSETAIHLRPAADHRGRVVGAVDRHDQRHGRRSRIAGGDVDVVRAVESPERQRQLLLIAGLPSIRRARARGAAPPGSDGAARSRAAGETAASTCAASPSAGTAAASSRLTASRSSDTTSGRRAAAPPVAPLPPRPVAPPRPPVAPAEPAVPAAPAVPAVPCSGGTRRARRAYCSCGARRTRRARRTRIARRAGGTGGAGPAASSAAAAR